MQPLWRTDFTLPSYAQFSKPFECWRKEAGKWARETSHEGEAPVGATLDYQQVQPTVHQCTHCVDIVILKVLAT